MVPTHPLGATSSSASSSRCPGLCAIGRAITATYCPVFALIVLILPSYKKSL